MAQVSVVIPAYNPGGYLTEAVRSALSQDYSDLEVVVIDDGSTDGVNYSGVARLDHRVQYVRQVNGGPSVARNRGILASDSPYIAFLDSDDLWDATKLSRQVDLMETEQRLLLCYTDFARGTDPQSCWESRLRFYRPRTPGRLFYDLLRENFIATSSVVVRRDALARSGLFDTELRGPEDIDLWLRLARTGDFGFVNEVVVYKRDHGANLTKCGSFARQHIKAFKKFISTWKDDPQAVAQIREKLGACFGDLGYAERLQGHSSDARSAYLQCARLRHNVLSSLGLAALLSLPRLLVDPLLKLAGADTSPAS